MDAKGFHYYFPAYLVWYLRYMDCEEEGFDSNTFDSVDYKLGVRTSNFYEDELFREWFSLFGKDEKRTIAHFLQFQREKLDFEEEYEGAADWYESAHTDIQKALDEYWGQFL